MAAVDALLTLTTTKNRIYTHSRIDDVFPFYREKRRFLHFAERTACQTLTGENPPNTQH